MTRAEPKRIAYLKIVLRSPVAVRILLALCVLFAVSAAPQYPAGAETSLRIAAATLPAGRGNPYLASSVPPVWIYAAMFDSLTQFDQNGVLRPSLATSWQQVSPTLWHLKLRQGVQFSNGESFDSAAVEASFQYLKTPEGQATAVARLINTIRVVRADGLYDLMVETNAPDPILPRRLATFRVPAPEWFSLAGPTEFSGAPIGTGPFRVESWSANGVELSAFLNAWRSPQVDRLEFLLIPDQASRVQALLSGSADVAFSLNPDDRSILQQAGGTIVADKGGANLVIAFRTGLDAPVQDVRVRRALNYAVNKAAMVEVLMAGDSEVASQPVPSNVPDFDSNLEPYFYDPDRARRLLAEAGYEDGFDLVIDLSMAGGPTPMQSTPWWPRT